MHAGQACVCASKVGVGPDVSPDQRGNVYEHHQTANKGTGYVEEAGVVSKQGTWFLTTSMSETPAARYVPSLQHFMKRSILGNIDDLNYLHPHPLHINNLYSHSGIFP